MKKFNRSNGSNGEEQALKVTHDEGYNVKGRGRTAF